MKKELKYPGFIPSPGKLKNFRKVYYFHKSERSTVVEFMPTNPKMEGLNPEAVGGLKQILLLKPLKHLQAFLSLSLLRGERGRREIVERERRERGEREEREMRE